jgi:hypothetical protein
LLDIPPPIGIDTSSHNIARIQASSRNSSEGTRIEINHKIVRARFPATTISKIEKIGKVEDVPKEIESLRD